MFDANKIQLVVYAGTSGFFSRQILAWIWRNIDDVIIMRWRCYARAISL